MLKKLINLIISRDQGPKRREYIYVRLLSSVMDKRSDRLICKVELHDKSIVNFMVTRNQCKRFRMIYTQVLKILIENYYKDAFKKDVEIRLKLI